MMSTELSMNNDHKATTVGDTLRNARESLGLSIRDMAEITRIQAVWLECIEQDRYSEMPAEVFIRGFLRNYTRELRLDEDAIFDRYLAQTGQLRAIAPAATSEAKTANRFANAHLANRSSSSRYLYAAAAAAVIALLAGTILTLSISTEPDAAATNFRVNDTTDAWQPALDSASDWRRQ